MNEFKFACPACKQHIKIGVEFESRRIDCPSCQATIIIPGPPSGPEEIPVATLAQPAAQPQTVAPAPLQPKPPVTPASPAKSEVEAAPPPAPTAPPPRPAPATLIAPISETRVAVLTPALKLEIVRAVRSALADPARWLPGKKEAGNYNYAARAEAGKLVSVAPADASATHLSLFGAVLREFHRRNVIRVTTGRRRFLDDELTAAIQTVLGRESDSAPPSEADREALTYPQCLSVLEVLEKRYEGDAQNARRREQERKIEHVRLADLVQKLEQHTPVRAEEVASALFYELEELNQRLEELEQKANSEE